MRALIEEVIRAVAVPEIVELPRLVGGTTIPHQFLIDKHFNGTKVPCEVARIRIGLGELRRRDLCIVLCRRWSGMPEPLLQFKQSHGLFGIEELRRNRGARTMASDVAPNVGRGYAGLCAKHRDQNLIQVGLTNYG